MSLDGSDSNAGLPPVLRQRDLLRTMGARIADSLGEVDDHVIIDCRILAGYGQFESQIIRNDGTSESIRTPKDVKNSLMELREKIMYSSATGTWLSARFVVNRTGAVDSDFNYDVEPEWSHELDPELYAQELRALPRDENYVPTWLRLKVDSFNDVD